MLASRLTAYQPILAMEAGVFEEIVGRLLNHTPLSVKYIGISVSKLAKLRLRANRASGPAFVKLAGCVLYRRDDLDAWIEANLVTPD